MRFGLPWLLASAPHSLKFLTRALEACELAEVQCLVAQPAELVAESALIVPERRAAVVDLDLARHGTGVVGLEVPPRAAPGVVRVATRFVPVAPKTGAALVGCPGK